MGVGTTTVAVLCGEGDRVTTGVTAPVQPHCQRKRPDSMTQFEWVYEFVDAVEIVSLLLIFLLQGQCRILRMAGLSFKSLAAHWLSLVQQVCQSQGIEAPHLLPLKQPALIGHSHSKSAGATAS